VKKSFRIWGVEQSGTGRAAPAGEPRIATAWHRAFRSSTTLRLARRILTGRPTSEMNIAREIPTSQTLGKGRERRAHASLYYKSEKPLSIHPTVLLKYIEAFLHALESPPTAFL